MNRNIKKTFIKFFFINLFFLNACEMNLDVEIDADKFDPKELIGTYKGHHNKVEDYLELKEDGSFTQTFILREGRSFENTGIWNYKVSNFNDKKSVHIDFIEIVITGMMNENPSMVFGPPIQRKP